MELYVHIPFCKKKCRYCAFTSFTGQEAYHQRYIELLLQEANNRKKEVNEPIKTVYIGGGTPSLLSSLLLQQLVVGLKQILPLDSVEEFTVEANPGTVSRQWLDTAVSLGINRISFGMQAYQDHLLKLLGRIHNFENVADSVRLAREAGLKNINLDLMFGIPTQTIHDCEVSTEAALSLNPYHLSAYGLIPEDGTPLFNDLQNGILSLPDPEDEREMYNQIIRKTAESGFHQYEISNFARGKNECRHNIGYWTQIPYLGFGISAASMTDVKVTAEGMSYIRKIHPADFEAYEKEILSGIAAFPDETVKPTDARFETVMLGLRMNAGVQEKDFYQKHHVTMEKCWGNKLARLQKCGLLIHEDGSWKLTARGFDIQNSILVELMDD